MVAASTEQLVASPAGPDQASASSSRNIVAKKRIAAALARLWPDGKGGISPLYWRCSQVLALIKTEHGGILPDDNEGRDYVHLLAHTIWSGCREPVLKLQKIVPRIAPWADVDAVIDDIAVIWKAHPRPYSGRRAGKLIELTDDERTRARAWSLKPVDKTDKQLAERRRRKKCNYQRRYRAREKAGAETAKERKAALAAKIMATEGCSRATAYRRLAAGGEVRIPFTESRPWEKAGFNCRRTWERHRACRKRETNPVANRETRRVTPHNENGAKSNTLRLSCRKPETKRVADNLLLPSSMNPPDTSNISPQAPSKAKQGLACNGSVPVSPADATARAVIEERASVAASHKTTAFVSAEGLQGSVFIAEDQPPVPQLDTIRAEELPTRPPECLIERAIAINTEIGRHKKNMADVGVRRLVERRWRQTGGVVGEWALRSLIENELAARDRFERRRRKWDDQQRERRKYVEDDMRRAPDALSLADRVIADQITRERAQEQAAERAEADRRAAYESKRDAREGYPRWRHAEVERGGRPVTGDDIIPDDDHPLTQQLARWDALDHRERFQFVREWSKFQVAASRDTAASGSPCHA